MARWASVAPMRTVTRSPGILLPGLAGERYLWEMDGTAIVSASALAMPSEYWRVTN